GYPVDVLEPSMALESDLGVDSIKRVQILGSLQERFPGVPAVGPERAAEMRTLADVASFLRDGLGLTAPASAAPESTPPTATETAASMPTATASAPHPVPTEASIERLRAVPRLLPAVDPLDEPFGVQPSALVIEVGDAGGAALVRHLRERGISVERIAIGSLAGSDAAGLLGWDGAAVEAALAAVAGSVRLDLCLLALGAPASPGAGSGVEPDRAGEDDRAGIGATGLAGFDVAARGLADAILATKGVVVPLRAAASAGRRAAFLTVTRVDGLLGHRGGSSIAGAVTAGVTGLVKTVALEAPELVCRSVDVHPALDDDTFAAAVLAEAVDSARDVVEVGLDSEGRRWSVKYVQGGVIGATEVTGATGATAPAALRPPVGPEDVLVVTGGARGVTARCVEELARRASCEFVLLGRTNLVEEPGWAAGVEDDGLKAAYLAGARAEGRKVRLPDVDAAAAAVIAVRQVRATLGDLSATGARIHYQAVDASDPVATAAALAPWRDRVTGVVHGAGALADAMLTDKTVPAIRSVLTPKLAGLRSVLTALEGAPLRHLVLFGSVAGVFGNPGQADYATANEALTRVAAWARTGLTGRVVALNWGAWDGGMVTADLRELFRSRGVTLLPPDEGARRFVAELVDGHGADGAVLIGGSAPLARTAGGTAPAAFVAHRSIAAMDTETVIDQYQIGPAPVLPATAGLGWLVNGVERALPGRQVVEVRNFIVHKGIVFDGAHLRDYWLDARPVDGTDGRPGDGRDGGPVTVSATVRGDSGGALPTSHYAGTLVLAGVTGVTGAAPTAPGWPADGYRLGEQGEDAAWVYTDGLLIHGPLMRGIRRLLVREPGRLVAECRLPELPFAGGAFAGALHRPVLCDILAAAGSVLARWTLNEVGALPIKIGHAEFFAPLPANETFIVVVDDVRPGPMTVTVTVTAHTPDGRVLQRLSDFTFVGTPDMADLIRQGAQRWQSGDRA
ncbi:KR domain-containing protein, partial [Frankia sp. CcWB3]